MSDTSNNSETEKLLGYDEFMNEVARFKDGCNVSDT